MRGKRSIKRPTWRWSRSPCSRFLRRLGHWARHETCWLRQGRLPSGLTRLHPIGLSVEQLSTLRILTSWQVGPQCFDRWRFTRPAPVEVFGKAIRFADWNVVGRFSDQRLIMMLVRMCDHAIAKVHHVIVIILILLVSIERQLMYS